MPQVSRTTLSGLNGKYISKTPGDRLGLKYNTFGLDALRSITGEDLARILLARMQPVYQELKSEWPIQTGASNESIALDVTDIEPKSARVALTIGGPQLINDPRNKSKKDYTPYVEFNGTSKTSPGTMTRVMVVNRETVARGVAEDLRALMQERMSGG